MKIQKKTDHHHTPKFSLSIKRNLDSITSKSIFTAKFLKFGADLV